MSGTLSSRHATWILHIIDHRGALTRAELANELRYLRPRILEAGQARRIMHVAVKRLVNRGELEVIGSDRHLHNLYAVTPRGQRVLEHDCARLAELGKTPDDTIPKTYTFPNGDTP